MYSVIVGDDGDDGEDDDDAGSGSDSGSAASDSVRFTSHVCVPRDGDRSEVLGATDDECILDRGVGCVRARTRGRAGFTSGPTRLRSVRCGSAWRAGASGPRRGW